MSSKAATRDKRRRTVMGPVTIMKELPVLSAKERAELLASLEAVRRKKWTIMALSPHFHLDGGTDIPI